MTPLSRHLVYLEAQGVAPLMLRMPLDGALPSVSWHDEDLEIIQDMPTVEIKSIVEVSGDNSIQAQVKQDLQREHKFDDKSALKEINAAIVQSVSTSTVAANFNFSVLMAGNLFLIDEIRGKSDRRMHQKILLNIAQSLSSNVSQIQFIDLNWPLKDNPQLDKSELAAQAFIQSWIESLVAKQQTRFVILLGDIAKQWFLEPLNQLHLASVNVSSAWEMLENPEKKSECWRLIRSYQALVSTPTDAKN